MAEKKNELKEKLMYKAVNSDVVISQFPVEE